MFSLDGNIVAVGLPAMREGLHTSYLLVGWTIISFQLGQLIALPLAGTLSDDLGRKRVFLVAVVVFTISSLLCGLAPSIYILIACRLLQALGGGAFLPSCTGLVSDLFPERRAQAVGMFSSIFPIGVVIGPNAGGLIIDHLSWRYIFYVNVPIGLMVLVLTLLLYHVVELRGSVRAVDTRGVALFSVAVTGLLVALSWLGDHPLEAGRTPAFWLGILLVVGLLAVFAWWERRTSDPMLDLKLLGNRAFLAVNVHSFLWGVAAVGFTSFLPTFAQVQHHLSATAAGAILTPRSLLQIGISTVAALAIVRSGYRLPLLGGAVLMIVSLVLTGQAPQSPVLFGMHIPGVIYLAAVIAILGVAFGISGPAINNVALDVVPGRVAEVTGIRTLFFFLGGTIGTALAVLMISLFADPGQGIRSLFLVLAGVVLCAMPLIFLIPDLRPQQAGPVVLSPEM
jgi:EmrB/QacA subfamily drug resistance transporter